MPRAPTAGASTPKPPAGPESAGPPPPPPPPPTEAAGMMVSPSFSIGVPYTRFTVTVSWAFSRISCTFIPKLPAALSLHSRPHGASVERVVLGGELAVPCTPHPLQRG